jgi:hypothetical protein
MSIETRQKISLANKGKKLSDEHKIKIGLASSGRKHPPRTEDYKNYAVIILQYIICLIFTKQIIIYQNLNLLKHQ